MTADNGNGGVCRNLGADDLSDEGLCADDIECGHTEEPLRLEDARIFKNLGSDWYGAVDRVGDDQEVRFGAVSDDTGDQVSHNAGVDLEEVIAGHARFTYANCKVLVPQLFTRYTHEECQQE